MHIYIYIKGGTFHKILDLIHITVMGSWFSVRYGTFSDQAGDDTSGYKNMFYIYMCPIVMYII